MAGVDGDRENWDLLGEYTNKTLRLKADRWGKAVQNEDNRSTILNFLDGEAELVVVSLNHSNQLVSTPEVPAGLRTKGVYYLKASDVPLVREEDNSNVREHVIFGDISPQPLDQLSTLIEEVIIPMLENPANRTGWPEMVCEDVSHQLYALRGTVYRMWGQLRGQTLLPLPFGMETLEKAERHALDTGEMTDSQLKSAIEGVVIKWVHQVEEVLVQDTDSLASPQHFPKPLEEITFWKKRRENLAHIASQLRDKKVMMMSNILEVTESAYYPAFMKMSADVSMAVEEARDIMIHFTPLKPLLEGLENGEFQDAPPILPPLVHCICLLWAACPPYRKPDRIVTLFKEITNLLISMGQLFIGTVGFQAETTEPLQKINTCVSVLRKFREIFEEHRAKVETYFPEGERPRSWEFHPTHAFSRMDQFLERLANIKEIFDVAKEFLKIEKVEFGGPKGKVLGANISSVYSEFNEAYTAFSILTYDCLDPAEDAFNEGHQHFKKKVTELEQRLSLIVKNALQESQSPEAYFKVVELLGSILERPIIQAEYTNCLPHLIHLLKQEIETAKELFERWQNGEGSEMQQDETKTEEEDVTLEEEEQRNERQELKDCSSLHRYFPPVVGKLKCLKEVRDRVAGNMQSFSQLNHPFVSSEDGMVLQRQWQEVANDVQEYIDKVVAEWQSVAGADYTPALSQPLLQRRHDSTIAVNFSAELVRALQELKYVWVVGVVLKEGAELAERRETFRKYTANLQLVADWYNHIKTNTNDVEFNLIRKEMEEIDTNILKAESELTWNSEGVWDYIANLRDTVSNLENRVQKAQSNIKVMDGILASWVLKPIFERKDGKKDALLNLEDREDRLKKVFNNMQRDGGKLKAMVDENQALLKVPEGSRHWDRYLLFLDNMITRGLVDAVSCSVFYLLDNCEPRVNQFPLLEARLELREPNLIISPSPEELVSLAESLVNDIVHISTLVPRLSTHAHATYLPGVEKDDEVVELKEALVGRFQVASGKIAEHRDQFLQHQALWRDRRQDVLAKFLTSGEGDAQPSLQQFKQQIDRYEALYTELEAIETTVLFDKWFRLDVRPFKHSLLENTKKWARMYKQHLINQVTNSLTELDKFIKEAEVGVAQDLGNGDYDILVSIMGHLVGVRERIHSTDAMFEPLKATIALVKQYGDDLPETMHLKLQVMLTTEVKEEIFGILKTKPSIGTI